MELAIRDEIIALKDPGGLIHPHDLIEWARDNEDSELHGHFEWNDTKAAHAWRLEQARGLIQVHVIDANLARLTISLPSDRVNGGGYRDRDTVLSNKEMRLEALLDALAEIERWQHRNNHFAKEFQTIFAGIARLKRRFPSPSPKSRHQPSSHQPGTTAPPPI